MQKKRFEIKMKKYLTKFVCAKNHDCDTCSDNNKCPEGIKHRVLRKMKCEYCGKSMPPSWNRFCSEKCEQRGLK